MNDSLINLLKILDFVFLRQLAPKIRKNYDPKER